MAKPTNSKPTNNQDNVFGQSDDTIANRTTGDIFRLGSALDPAVNPATGYLWFGTGNPNTGWNLTDKGKLETGLKIIHRGGADYTPTGTGANGEQYYTVNAGLQIGNPARAEWNFNYVVNTGVGGLAKNPDLAAYDFKMQITQSGPSFLPPHSAVFALNAATHEWVDQSNSAVKFGGDDFAPGNAASPAVMAHIAENSVNLAFVTGDFGSLAASTVAGTEYDIKLVGFKSGNLETFTHDHITLVAPPV
jgi:hypothetical protein